jgi:predicted nucleic acid-binding protein
MEYEVTSALRKAIAAKAITMQDAISALDKVGMINIRKVAPTKELNQLSLKWAEKLRQVVAYDAQYLAVAEQEGADLWTADKRLVNTAHQLGIVWIHWIGESKP